MQIDRCNIPGVPVGYSPSSGLTSSCRGGGAGGLSSHWSLFIKTGPCQALEIYIKVR